MCVCAHHEILEMAGSRGKRSFRGVSLGPLGMDISFYFEIGPQEGFCQSKRLKNHFLQVRDPWISASNRAMHVAQTNQCVQLHLY